MSTVLPTNRWKLGLFVILGVFLTLAFLGWLGASRLERESMEAHYYFDQDVNGLEVGSPVKFRGVPIGKVTDIRAAADQRHVEVVAEVFVDALEAIGLERDSTGPEDGPFVPEDLRVQLVTSVLTGVGFIQGDFFDPEQYPVPEYPFEVPWNTVHTVPSTYKSLEGGLLAIAERLPAMTEEISTLTRHVDGAVQDLDAKGLSARAQDLMATADDLLSRFDRLPVVEQSGMTLAQIERTFAELELLFAEVRAEDGPLQTLARRYGEVGDRVDGALVEARLPETTAAVREAGLSIGAAAEDVSALTLGLEDDLDTLREALTAIRRLAEFLERDPGALLRGRSPGSPPELDAR